MKSPEGSIEHREPGEGSRLLHELERSGNYVFHGSPVENIAELEARQPYTWTDGVEQEDGHPCVAATQFADIAIFRALVFDDTTGFGQNEDHTLHFEATEKALKAVPGRVGFIYVLPKTHFVPRHGDEQEMEWRSETNEHAVQIIRVTEYDLPKHIQILPPNN